MGSNSNLIGMYPFCLIWKRHRHSIFCLNGFHTPHCTHRYLIETLHTKPCTTFVSLVKVIVAFKVQIFQPLHHYRIAPLCSLLRSRSLKVQISSISLPLDSMSHPLSCPLPMLRSLLKVKGQITPNYWIVCRIPIS